MTELSSQVLIGMSGHLSVAPLGTTMPTDLTALPAAWDELGYTDENGVSIAVASTILDVKAWQSLFVIRRQVTDLDLTIVTALRQWNSATLKLSFGGGVVTVATGVYKYVPPAPENSFGAQSLVVDVLDGTQTVRWCFPGVMVTSSGTHAFNRAAASDLPITFGLVGQPGVDPFQVYTNKTDFSLS